MRNQHKRLISVVATQAVLHAEALHSHEMRMFTTIKMWNHIEGLHVPRTQAFMELAFDNRRYDQLVHCFNLYLERDGN